MGCPILKVKYTLKSFNGSDTSISNDIVPTKIYDKRDDFEIVNIPFIDGDVPCSTYILWRLYFSNRISGHVADFNTFNKLVTQTLLKQDYGYHKLSKTFSFKLYCQYLI